MKIQKTIKIPVSAKITKEKLEKLNRLTARITYTVQLFLTKIIENDITTIKEAEKFKKEIESITGGYEDDRDVNAAKNILRFGLKRLNKVSRKGTGAAVNRPELPMIAAKLEGRSPALADGLVHQQTNSKPLTFTLNFIK